ncbi:unnamed protein product [Vitrella brassicaformis CCMP3155]|uniref:Uncharacterized protein n=1 Tax=Vitrella brassicaformis (strain CCMP3155) TaxID=1169540 RepID=A0A0G4EAL2_VITBC|nr:unnamed protein product [Vitrella brassicaformis CCMP3155]|eukprot:CEL92303.1 unnamed protein product [Vitrella brassicaformis CCMP3155]
MACLARRIVALRKLLLLLAFRAQPMHLVINPLKSSITGWSPSGRSIRDLWNSEGELLAEFSASVWKNCPILESEQTYPYLGIPIDASLKLQHLFEELEAAIEQRFQVVCCSTSTLEAKIQHVESSLLGMLRYKLGYGPECRGTSYAAPRPLEAWE